MNIIHSIFILKYYHNSAFESALPRHLKNNTEKCSEKKKGLVMFC